jgi:hypothetical protein
VVTSASIGSPLLSSQFVVCVAPASDVIVPGPLKTLFSRSAVVPLARFTKVPPLRSFTTVLLTK